MKPPADATLANRARLVDNRLMADTLSIHDVIPDLLEALGNRARAVLQAPPGAGKTTVVPLSLLRAGLCAGRILMLEPRRLAARAAAERMAETLAEEVGETVGYRMRGAAKVSDATRVEVVTEGILTRMIQTDPALSGVGAVIFDEFHERSLNADLGLAMCLDLAGALREDLILLAMSATLEAAPVADLMGGAPVITSRGRNHPVDIRHLDRPLRKGARLEPEISDLIATAVAETGGGVLVFLPGEAEIRRTERLLRERLPASCEIRPLFGAMDFTAQRAALAPVRDGRKVVLATAIAETSLTIPDIRVVVDGGKARRARFDPGSGMSRLVTEPVTRAEAAQRAGRAGRIAKGVCYRLWTKGEEGALMAHPPAEIEAADLAGLALELALWGAAPDDLPFLTEPNPRSFAEAKALLRMLGALDAKDRITAHGRLLAELPLHPRLAHMLAVAGPGAAQMAALLADRDPLARGAPVDLSLRLSAIRDPDAYAARHPWSANRGAVARIRAEAKRLEKRLERAARRPGQGTAASPAGPGMTRGTASDAALAYPDRIGLRRKGDAPRYVLSGGKGAVLPDGDPLSGARLVVATDLDGDPREARIRQAASIQEADLRRHFAAQIAWHDLCAWSRRDRRVITRRQERFGALVLDDRQWTDAPPELVARAMIDGVRDLGLTWSDAAVRFAARVELARGAGRDLPEMTAEALLQGLEDWLLPYLTGLRTAQDWKRFEMLEPLRAQLSWEQMQTLDREVPAHFTTPLGRRIPIDYSDEQPAISLRLQEMFGQAAHPRAGGRPLRVTLLSPGGKPVQTTTDIPGFWSNSYPEVRRDMRGRYPRHPWPEDPLAADPTLRARPRSRR